MFPSSSSSSSSFYIVVNYINKCVIFLVIRVNINFSVDCNMKKKSQKYLVVKSKKWENILSISSKQQIQMENLEASNFVSFCQWHSDFSFFLPFNSHNSTIHTSTTTNSFVPQPDGAFARCGLCDSHTQTSIFQIKIVKLQNIYKKKSTMKNGFITTLTTLTKINSNFSFYLFCKIGFCGNYFAKLK